VSFSISGRVTTRRAKLTSCIIRSTSGASIGTNVRDAANFGIWALARRYTTAELQAIDISAAVIHLRYTGCSILQILATELVVTASLDPAGNIRRGSSAALQELIGRHPNTIDEGIKLVQVVDYHAVALRSRAVTEVATHASQLSTWYLKGLLDGLLGWRGIGDPDVSHINLDGSTLLIPRSHQRVA